MTAARLTWLLALLALVAALAGLLVDGVYEGSEATAEMFRAHDLVTTLGIVPGLALTARAVQHDSVSARLVKPSDQDSMCWLMSPASGR